MIICCSCGQPKQFAYITLSRNTICLECSGEVLRKADEVHLKAFFDEVRKNNEEAEREKL